MKYREEVEAIISNCSTGAMRAMFVEVIGLGVRLGLEAAAGRLDDLEHASAAAEVRDIHPGYVLQVKT